MKPSEPSAPHKPRLGPLTNVRYLFLFSLAEAQAMQDDLPFKVVWTNAHDEIIARAANLIVGRAAYETARRLYPQDRIDYRCGARVIERSDEGS